MTGKAKERINWMSVIAAFVALITLSAHFMWVGSSLAGKADVTEVQDNEARVRVLEAMQQEQKDTLIRIERKVDAINEREMRHPKGD